jgi:hypothetical protein
LLRWYAEPAVTTRVCHPRAVRNRIFAPTASRFETVPTSLNSIQ